MKMISPIPVSDLRAASDLRSLSDSELHERTLEAAAAERLATHQLLEHLREVSRRHLYADLGYPSLWEYCTGALKLSAGSAQRRISALRLTEAVPEVEAKIIDGSISLSVASQAQSFFHKEGKLRGQRFEPEEKKEIVRSLEGLSLEDASRTLLSMSSAPEQHYGERLKPIAPRLTELKLAITPEQRELFERVRGLIAHQGAGPLSWSELFEKMARVALERLDPAREPRQKAKSAPEKQVNSKAALKSESVSPTKSKESPSESPPIGVRHCPELPPIGGKRENRAPSAPLRRKIWRRDQGKCQNCGSSHALQIDHIQDWSFGGETREENLQLLCRSCHRRKTFRTHGERAG